MTPAEIAKVVTDLRESIAHQLKVVSGYPAWCEEARQACLLIERLDAARVEAERERDGMRSDLRRLLSATLKYANDYTLDERDDASCTSRDHHEAAVALWAGINDAKMVLTQRVAIVPIPQ